jgi:hypothetical protein
MALLTTPEKPWLADAEIPGVSAAFATQPEARAYLLQSNGGRLIYQTSASSNEGIGDDRAGGTLLPAP